MTPFLQQVAHYYTQQSIPLEDYCFIFPNRRAGVFFTDAMKTETMGRVAVLPETMAMTDFVSRVTRAVPVAPIEALFTLYDCYKKVSGNEAYEFDRFVRWGNIILHDFNDVDMALANPKQLFTNIKEYREITSDYLDDELKAVLEKYLNLRFAAPAPRPESEVPSFWKHLDPQSGDSDVKQNYLHLWQQLYELYREYGAVLAEKGLTYTGQIYRDAARVLKESNADQLPWKRIVFVGFNMLSLSEVVMFNALSKKGVADFFWDNANPVFRLDSAVNKTNEAARRINAYAEMFAMPHDFTLEEIDRRPQLEVVTVPSSVGQAKVAFDLLGELSDDAFNSPRTAIVLPDELQLLPLLDSIPERAKELNVTMGYTMRYSDVASLLRVVALAHRRARAFRDANTGWDFYREDVKDVLSHPIIKRHFSTKALQLVTRIDNENLYYVPWTLLEKLPFAVLFKAQDAGAPQPEIEAYLDELRAFIVFLCDKTAPSKTVATVDENEDTDDAMPLQYAFYRKMVESLDYISAAMRRHGSPLSSGSLLYLLERLASSDTIALEGKPLRGLQVMGLLETRCIDFEHLVLLSVNERILPGKYRPNSFITDGLRRVFGLPTAQNREAMMAYHFYRLLSRVKKAWLVYDESSQRVGSSEPSRYLSQIRMLYRKHFANPLKTIHYKSLPKIVAGVDPAGSSKNERAMKYLNAFLDENSGKYLSASAINKYFNCPMQYYLSHVEDISEDDSTSDFMEATTFGTIVHDTLQNLYYPPVRDAEGKLVKRSGTYVVTGAMIENFLKKGGPLESELRRQVNIHYLHKTPEDPHIDDALRGDAAITAEAMTIFIKRALKYDLDLIGGANGVIEVLECEEPHTVRFPLDAEGTRHFNFNFKADRVDRVNGSHTVRIVDYKTGASDVTAFASIDDLFDSSKYFDRPHAALQLLLYCHAYAIDTKTTNPVQPVVYKLQAIDETGLWLKEGRNKTVEITSYDMPQLGSFLPKLQEHLQKLFNPDEPFTLVPMEKEDQDKKKSTFKSTPCDDCTFVDLCNR